ncbi:hypothetical protein MRX96_039416 [Rhipicephalus microplus]
MVNATPASRTCFHGSFITPGAPPRPTRRDRARDGGNREVTLNHNCFREENCAKVDTSCGVHAQRAFRPCLGVMMPGLLSSTAGCVLQETQARPGLRRRLQQHNALSTRSG